MGPGEVLEDNISLPVKGGTGKQSFSMVASPEDLAQGERPG